MRTIIDTIFFMTLLAIVAMQFEKDLRFYTLYKLKIIGAENVYTVDKECPQCPFHFQRMKIL